MPNFGPIKDKLVTLALKLSLLVMLWFIKGIIVTHLISIDSTCLLIVHSLNLKLVPHVLHVPILDKIYDYFYISNYL